MLTVPAGPLLSRAEGETVKGQESADAGPSLQQGHAEAKHPHNPLSWHTWGLSVSKHEKCPTGHSPIYPHSCPLLKAFTHFVQRCVRVHVCLATFVCVTLPSASFSSVKYPPQEVGRMGFCPQTIAAQEVDSSSWKLAASCHSLRLCGTL